MQSWVSYKSFHLLWCWVIFVSLWEMVSHPSRCDLTVVRINAVIWARMEWWRRLDSVRWCGLSCLSLLRTESEEYTTHDNMCHHVSDMERLAYKFGMLQAVCHAWLSGDGSYLCDQSLWHSLWTSWTTWCKRGHLVWETLALQAGSVCRGTVANRDIHL
jgi:hypothetical protein